MVDERSQWLTEAGGEVRLAVTSELQSKAQSTLNKPFKLSDNTRHFLVNCFSELKDMPVFRIESLHIFHRITVMYCFVLKWPWNPIKHYQRVLPQFPCLPEIGFFWIVFGTFFFWGNREYLFLRVCCWVAVIRSREVVIKRKLEISDEENKLDKNIGYRDVCCLSHNKPDTISVRTARQDEWQAPGQGGHG